MTASEDGYVHGIDGESFPDTAPIAVTEGEGLRLTVVNDTMMFQPIHLHGHTFQLVRDGSARKDTVNVLPMSSVVFRRRGRQPRAMDAAGSHHVPPETGMATVLSYRA